jgi:glycosyltransferase involved in cell wall biosynthesis
MKVSVIVPLFNNSTSIEQTLRSILAQSYGNFEIIVVDDGSTDGGAEVVKSLGNPRVRLIQQANSGAAAARNTGIKQATGEWIAFLDADDLWSADNLASHLEILNRNPGIVWSAGACNLRLANSRLVKMGLPKKLAMMLRDDIFEDAIFLIGRIYCMNTNTIMVRREIFENVGLMNTTLNTAEDLDMWLRIALKYPKLAYCHEPIAEYYVGNSNSLAHRGHLEENGRSLLSFVRSCLYTSKKLGTERAQALCDLCKRLLKAFIAELILNGRHAKAVMTIREFDGVLGKKLKIKYLFLSRVPSPLLQILLRVKRLFSP